MKRAYIAMAVGCVLAVALPITYLILTPWLEPPEEPGNLSSPTLARLLNESIDAALAEMNPMHAPGLIPEAAANSRVFLRELKEVVARCRMGRLEPNQKYNRLEYHLVRVDGVRLKPIVSGVGMGCGTNPLIFRATFKDGRVAEAFTDGRERQYSVAEVSHRVREFGKNVTWSDWGYHRERYFPPEPPAPPPQDVAKEWE
ncbi:hypothetical protein [Corallococcus sicarius]|nr:hypothetical protein [Corallococcus sicarius]